MYDNSRRRDDRDRDLVAQFQALPVWVMMAAAAVIAFVLVNIVLR